MSGMGELHLEILKDRMSREFNVEASTGAPMVAYYETVTKAGRGEHRFDREIGGGRQFGHVIINVSPAVRGKGNLLKIDTDRGSIPAEFRDAITDGINAGLTTGVLARYPITDTLVTVVGGSFEPDISTEVAFRSASLMALKDAIIDANPQLLEPIMMVEIATPSEPMGDVMGDLNGRRGKIRELVARDSCQIIHALVPLAELFGYATVIRSLSRGRASYVLEPTQFEIVPDEIREKLLNR